MTPIEHEKLALQMRGLAQQALPDWLADLMRLQYGIAPEPGRSQSLEAMRSKLRGKQEEYSTIALPWLDPASSDMQAALFQEAFAELSEKTQTTVASGLTAKELTALQKAARGPQSKR